MVVVVAVTVILLQISLITTTLTNICLSIVEWEEKVLLLLLEGGHQVSGIPAANVPLFAAPPNTVGA